MEFAGKKFQDLWPHFRTRGSISRLGTPFKLSYTSNITAALRLIGIYWYKKHIFWNFFDRNFWIYWRFSSAFRPRNINLQVRRFHLTASLLKLVTYLVMSWPSDFCFSNPVIPFTRSEKVLAWQHEKTNWKDEGEYNRRRTRINENDEDDFNS